jgi:hypothetical protein
MGDVGGWMMDDVYKCIRVSWSEMIVEPLWSSEMAPPFHNVVLDFKPKLREARA